jgi:predicted Fe-Mo cluster-binding NifX family protein
MRICIPTIGKEGLDEKVHNHFGSAKYFLIYDIESKEISYIENDNAHHSHGMCQPLKAIANQNVDVVLTSGMGGRAIQLLNGGGVKVYILEGDTVKEAIEKFESNSLKELTPESGCKNHDCH